MVRSVVIATALLLSALTLRAESITGEGLETDTLRYRYTPIDQTPGIVEFGLRLYDYLHLLPDEAKRANVAVVALPAYSITTGLRVVALGNIEYRSVCDKEQIDNLQILASASLTRYYDLIIDGTNHFDKKRHGLHYNATAISAPSRLYGLNYAQSSINNPGHYIRQTLSTTLGYSWHVTEWLLLGTELDYSLVRAIKLNSRASEIAPLDGSKYSGLGITLMAKFATHKTLDINSERGLHAHVSATLKPSFISSYNKTLWQLGAMLTYYQPLWRGALVAANIYAKHQPTHTHWILRLSLGSEDYMRGYYPTRYNGNTLVGGQAELRQQIWESLVVAAWVGAGGVASVNDPLAWHKILPDYGVGIRWYTSPTSALTIDLGFGRRSHNLQLGLSQRF
ncbi:MAG: hypothetical protein IKV29_00120 [Alistipes sp.]|nr:hypothetical protein [Alistipes sp.]